MLTTLSKQYIESYRPVYGEYSRVLADKRPSNEVTMATVSSQFDVVGDSL